MDARALSSVLVSGISLLGIALICLFLVSDYRLDAYRNKLFAIRDQLFDLVLTSDGMSFDHPAYQLLNLRVNSLIRYAHKTKITLFVLLFISAKFFSPERKRPSSRTDKQLRSAMQGLRRFQQFALIQSNDQISMAVQRKLVFFSSPIDSTKRMLPTSNRAPKASLTTVASTVESQAIMVFELQNNDQVGALGSC